MQKFKRKHHLHRARVSAGFSLVEVLVVVAVLALTTALVLPRLGTSVHVQDRRAVAALVQALRTARNEAVADQSETWVEIDLAGAQYAASNGGAGPLPADIDADMVIAAREQVSGDIGRFRFYPNGMSTGGRVTFTGAGRVSRRVAVDWMTGHISAEAGDAAS